MKLTVILLHNIFCTSALWEKYFWKFGKMTGTNSNHMARFSFINFESELKKMKFHINNLHNILTQTSELVI